MKKEIIERIKKTEWHADWGGTTPLLDVSFAPDLYFHGLERRFGKGYTNLLVIYKKGVAQGFLPEREYVRLGIDLARKLKTIEAAQKWSREYVKLADRIVALVNLPPMEFLKKWEKSEKLYGDFGAYGEATKTVFDVSGGKLSQDIKEILIASRKYSESFYSKSSRVYARVIAQLKRPRKYKSEDMLMMTRQELMQFIKNEKLPPVETLEGRRECCGIYFNREGIVFLDKQEVDQIEAHWRGSKVHKKLSGTVAYKGNAVGKCRVVKNFRAASIKIGDILVTGMTNPNYLPLMKRAGAIITDGGGMLSHAAIVARELKKPCVIGTKIATQVLHDGDLVEVDAENGIVKILKYGKR
jgi:phosphohistidine swiveling domain-containing protein